MHHTHLSATFCWYHGTTDFMLLTTTKLLKNMYNGMSVNLESARNWLGLCRYGMGRMGMRGHKANGD